MLSHQQDHFNSPVPKPVGRTGLFVIHEMPAIFQERRPIPIIRALDMLSHAARRSFRIIPSAPDPPPGRILLISGENYVLDLDSQEPQVLDSLPHRVRPVIRTHGQPVGVKVLCVVSLSFLAMRSSSRRPSHTDAKYFCQVRLDSPPLRMWTAKKGGRSSPAWSPNT